MNAPAQAATRRPLKFAYAARPVAADLGAGLTTGVLLAPQAMAYAQLAGLPPMTGLYAAAIPPLLYGFIGQSRQLSVGPVAMDSIMVASIIASLSISAPEQAVAVAGVLALIVGVVQFIAGRARIGWVSNLVSRPVLAGFTAAAAIVILHSQLKTLLGLPASPASMLLAWVGEGAPLTAPQFATSAVGVAGLVVFMLARKLPGRLARVPWPFFVLAGMGVLDLALHWTALGVGVVGDVGSGGLVMALPEIPVSMLPELLPAGAALAAISFMEAWSSASRFAEPGKDELSADRELMALGAVNVAQSFFGGYPVAGGLSRTAVNARAGARTGWSAALASVIVIALVVFAPGLVSTIPRAALAALIISGVLSLVDVAYVRMLLKVSRQDAAMWVVAFASTISLGLVRGLVTAVLVSLALFVYRRLDPHSAVLGFVEELGAWKNVLHYPAARAREGVVVVRVDGQLWHGNVPYVEAAVDRALTKDGTRALVLDAVAINQIDATALHWLEQLKSRLAGDGIRLMLAGPKAPVRKVLDAGNFRCERDCAYVATIEEAMRTLETAGVLVPLGNLNPASSI
jgi:SulP family sulfate permease